MSLTISVITLYRNGAWNKKKEGKTDRRQPTGAVAAPMTAAVPAS